MACMHIPGFICGECRDRTFMRDPQWVISPVTIQPVGWTCPKCEAVMNPNMPSCFYCKPKEAKKP